MEKEIGNRRFRPILGPFFDLGIILLRFLVRLI